MIGELNRSPSATLGQICGIEQRRVSCRFRLAGSPLVGAKSALAVGQTLCLNGERQAGLRLRIRTTKDLEGSFSNVAWQAYRAVMSILSMTAEDWFVASPFRLWLNRKHRLGS